MYRQIVMRRAEAVFEEPRIDSSPSSLSLDQPLIEIRPRWERLAELGFSPDEFGFIVAAYSDGAFVGEFIDGDDKIDMFLFSTAGNRQQLSELAQVPISTPNGQVMPLSALAELRETVDSEELRRVKDQLKGSLMLSLESTTARMSNLARQDMYFDRFFDLDEIIAAGESEGER